MGLAVLILAVPAAVSANTTVQPDSGPARQARIVGSVGQEAGASGALPVRDGVTTRVSVGPGGRQANGNSFVPAVSADGRYVVFASHASNLVPADTNRAFDVFVRDRAARVTRLVSVGPGGRQGNNTSFAPGISSHGRYVAFNSYASNLVPADTNGTSDVFVRDRITRVTRRVSVGPEGQQANGGSFDAKISAHGRYVVFASDASNLVPADTNDTEDVFVRDRVAQVTRRVSVGADGGQANGSSGSFGAAVSAHGRFVVFASDASNLVAGDTNGTFDVFVRDRRLQVTRRVSVGPDGQQANNVSDHAAVSADGRYVVFESAASNLVPADTNDTDDVFVRDRRLQVTRRVSVGPGGQQANDGSGSFSVAVSDHGRYVVFDSFASNLVAGDTNDSFDVFVRDRVAQVTRRVSVGPGGRQANGLSFELAVSAHGRYVAFASDASTLVPADTNNRFDVFVRDRNP